VQALDLFGQVVGRERLDGLDNPRLQYPPSSLHKTPLRYLVR
jgi:hypothetical protein